MEHCIFCKIVARQIPAEVIFEDDMTMVIMDLKPVNPGHALVIPKSHHADFASAPEAIVREMASAAQKAAVAVMQATQADGCNIYINNGAAAGQAVMHLHQHVIPRNAGDGYELWHGTDYADGAMAKVAAQIRDAYRRSWL